MPKPEPLFPPNPPPLRSYPMRQDFGLFRIHDGAYWLAENRAFRKALRNASEAELDVAYQLVRVMRRRKRVLHFVLSVLAGSYLTFIWLLTHLKPP